MSSALLAQIKAALDGLAMAPERQLERAKELGVGNDELALEFDDVSRGRVRLVAEGIMSRDQAAMVAAVELQLSKMTSAGPARWKDTAILTGEDWAELRRLAQSAAHALGQ
jgi:hypothetical protein